jgi:signal transduction histidine kinase
MINPDNRLFCRLDGLTVVAREAQRLQVMADLGLLNSESVPVFEEATQTAAQFLDVPICILGLMESDRQRLRSAVGLSRFGLMNELAIRRQFPRLESFCTHVVDSYQVLTLNDTLAHPAFAGSILTQQYGVRAYMGVPLITSSGYCIGTLAVMDFTPRNFTNKEVEFLELTARWSMSEQERQLFAPKTPAIAPEQLVPQTYSPNTYLANQLRIELLGQLTEELRTPLTSVMGMASVLIREIYGPLTDKQKKYLDIVHHSGKYLLSLVNEILELSSLQNSAQQLNRTFIDVEMLCQQAVTTLEHAAKRREQQIRLTVEPGHRIWSLDKDKVRQMLYHLVFSVIQSSNTDSIIRLHVSRKGTNLNIAIWVSHPWLGEGLPCVEAYPSASLVPAGTNEFEPEFQTSYVPELEADYSSLIGSDLVGDMEPHVVGQLPCEDLHRNVGLLLSRQIAEMHGGDVTLQGNSESGYRYVINLPQPAEAS